MEVHVSQDGLKRGLGTVRGAAATTTMLPITKNVLFQTVPGGVRLTAYNLEVAASVTVAGKVITEGTATTPVKTLWDIVGKWPKGQVSLTNANGGGGLAAKSGSRQITLHGAPSAEFLPIPAVKASGALIPSVGLIEAVDAVAFAAATENTRPVLSGCKVGISEGQMTVVAADGFRLVVKKVPGIIGDAKDCVIPTPTLRLIRRLLSAKGNTSY